VFGDKRRFSQFLKTPYFDRFGSPLRPAGKPERMAAMKNPTGTAVLVGGATFIASYVGLLGCAMVRFSYYSGPVPDLLYGLPIPLMIATLAAVIAFRVKGSN
jgi:hypothetical protein